MDEDMQQLWNEEHECDEDEEEYYESSPQRNDNPTDSEIGFI